MKISDNDLTKIVNTVKSQYEEDLISLKKENESIRETLDNYSTVGYGGGVPDLHRNRGDQSTAFSFPFKWALTAKDMENSQYIQPVLKQYKTIFSSFDFTVECEDAVVKEYVLKMHSDDIGTYLSTLFYNHLKFGFIFFTTKTKLIYDNNTIKSIPVGINVKDPTGIQQFLFDDKNTTKLRKIRLITSPKGVVDSSTYYNDLFSSSIETTPVEIINYDIDDHLVGYINYDATIEEDVIGRPFAFQAYSTWRILNEMDASFYKNLKTMGEHSMNLIPHNSSQDISDIEIKKSIANARTFIQERGGIFIDKRFKIEKIENLDPSKWADFRESLVAEMWKSLGVDNKSLGMTKGATRDLSEQMQANTLSQGFDLAKDFIRQYNCYLKRVSHILFGVEAKIIIKPFAEDVQNDSTTTPTEKKENFSAIDNEIIITDNPIQEKNAVLEYEFEVMNMYNNMISAKVTPQIQDEYERFIIQYRLSKGLPKKIISDESIEYINNTVDKFVSDITYTFWHRYDAECFKGIKQNNKNVKDLYEKSFNKLVKSKEIKVFKDKMINDINLSTLSAINDRKGNDFIAGGMNDTVLAIVTFVLKEIWFFIYKTNCVICSNMNDNLCVQAVDPYASDESFYNGLYYLGYDLESFYDPDMNVPADFHLLLPKCIIYKEVDK